MYWAKRFFDLFFLLEEAELQCWVGFGPRKKNQKKKWIILFDFFFFFRKTFLRKLFFQNVFWIDCGSGKHKKKFWTVERGRERQKLRQKSEQFDQVQNWWSSSNRHRGTFFVWSLLFFANPIPSSARITIFIRQQTKVNF